MNKPLRRTNKQIAVDDLLENSVSCDKNDLDKIKKRLKQERLEKLLKRLKQMTDMERDIYDRACVHYKKKYRSNSISKHLYGWMCSQAHHIIEEYWEDYFSGKPLYF